MVTADGFTVEPGITIPDNARGLAIGIDGTVTAILGTGGTATNIGQIELARFINQSGLQAIGDNLFMETASSGAQSPAIQVKKALARFGRVTSNSPT